MQSHTGKGDYVPRWWDRVSEMTHIGCDGNENEKFMDFTTEILSLLQLRLCLSPSKIRFWDTNWCAISLFEGDSWKYQMMSEEVRWGRNGNQWMVHSLPVSAAGSWGSVSHGNSGRQYRRYLMLCQLEGEQIGYFCTPSCLSLLESCF